MVRILSARSRSRETRFRAHETVTTISPLSRNPTDAATHTQDRRRWGRDHGGPRGHPLGRHLHRPSPDWWLWSGPCRSDPRGRQIGPPPGRGPAKCCNFIIDRDDLSVPPQRRRPVSQDCSIAFHQNYKTSDKIHIGSTTTCNGRLSCNNGTRPSCNAWQEGRR